MEIKNGMDYLNDKLDYAIRYFESESREIQRMKRLFAALPVEIQNLTPSYMWTYYVEKMFIQYNEPSYFKTLKMCGVIGLKRVFGGSDKETDWRWEGGEMIVKIDDDTNYYYHFDISKADKPTSCRFEEQEVEVPARVVKKLVAICPESLEEI